MERAGLARTTHKMSQKDKQHLMDIVNRLHRVTGSTVAHHGADSSQTAVLSNPAPRGAKAANGAEILDFPREFFDFFKVENAS